jgi:Tol biopolymer transport system component
MDTDGDGRFSATEGEALILVDLTRSLEAALQPPAAQVSSVDWSPVANPPLLVFTSLVTNVEDIFRVFATGQEALNLTTTTTIRERHPRIDPTGQVAVFERIDTAGTPPKGEIWIFRNSRDQVRITMGGSAGAALAGTPYIVGSDADPDYAPDGSAIVFRRLRAIGAAGTGGEWDIMTVSPDGSNLRTIVTGPAFRGAPDWGPEGIAFNEIDTAGSRLVVVNGDGTGARNLVTLARGFEASNPRWLP